MNRLRVICWSPLCLLCVLLAAPAQAVIQLQPGEPAPEIEATALDGTRATLSGMRGRATVLVFGELYHEKTLEACRRLAQVLEAPRLRGQRIATLLVVTQPGDPEQAEARPPAQKLPRPILHDAQRKAFEAYRIAVLPSVVIVDAEGRVVHALASLTPQFSDVLTDALLLTAGVIDQQQFDQRLTPSSEAGLTSEQVRARRLTSLGEQLARRGLVSLAIEKYQEALALDDRHTPAHLGLGKLELNRRRLAGAEQHFRKALALQPDSTEAALGLAFVQTLRGGEELTPAEQLVRRVLVAQPAQGRAHYLLGVIHENRGQNEQAVGSFKKAAELLIEQLDRERAQ